MVQRRSFDEAVLERLHDVACVKAFDLLQGHFKRDVTFMPFKDPNTERWHCSTSGGECELPVSGPKWYDTGTRAGGGGAIDLVMELCRLDFVASVNLLVGKGL